MYRRDFILRLIERFGRALMALRNRILKREAEAAPLQAEIQGIAHEAGLDLDLARRLDPRTLVMWLAPTGEVDEAKFWLLGELLYLEGLGAQERGEAEGGRDDMARAHAVFSKLPAGWRPGADLASAGERCQELAERLASTTES
jgi:hypothetical protein